MPTLRNISPGTWAGLGLVAALCLFPFALALVTGQPVDAGLRREEVAGLCLGDAGRRDGGSDRDDARTHAHT